MPSAKRPAPTDPLVALADQCVQCGLCLPACPTYNHERQESESPRGRIALVRAWALDTVPATPIGDTHLDHCLACRSCEVVCPAGVQYGELLTTARVRQRARRLPTWRQRLAEAITARPRALALFLAAYRLAFPWLPTNLRRLPRPPAADRSEQLAAIDFAHSTNSPSVGLFVGCVSGPYEAGLRAAVGKLCSEIGIRVHTPANQTCCGSLHAHAGNAELAATLAGRNRDAFADCNIVLTLASGCHESVATALDGNRQARDAIAFIAEHADLLQFRASDERVAVHFPCTQRNLVRSVPALRRLLAAVPGLETFELDAGFGCCGAAGTAMLTDPDRAAEYRQPLLDQLAASGANRLLSANIGCRLHLGNGTALPVQHPLEWLAGQLDHNAN